MKPFVLVDARSAGHAVEQLALHGAQAQVIAAGGDLLGLLKEHVEGPTLVSPQVLVNLATAADLRGVERSSVSDAAADNHIRLGSMLTLQELQRIPGLPPMLAEAIASIASPQLRVRTTLGGNLLQRPRCLYFRHPDLGCFKKGSGGCTAVGGPPEAWPGALYPGVCHAGHPSDLAAVLMALDAKVVLLGPRGERQLGMEGLFRDAGSTPGSEACLLPGEILTAVLVPTVATRHGFFKAAPRAANEFAWAGAAVALEEVEGRITEARIACSGIAPGPHLFVQAPALLSGRRMEEIYPARVATELVDRTDLSRRPLERVLAAQLAVERALERALERDAA